MFRRLSLLLSFLALLFTGCAETKHVFRISELPDRKDGDWPVWPKGAEVPRFVYVGDLTGEQNYQPESGSEDSRSMLAWLVGLGQEVVQPVVLQRPQGVAEDGSGRIWVSDVSRAGVFLFDPTAGELQVFDLVDEVRHFVAPIGLAPLPDGGVLVSDAELKVIVDLGPDGRPRRIFGDGVLQRPTGLAYDRKTGQLYVADTRANDIKVFNAWDGSLLDTVGSEGDGSGQLNSPTYLALSSDRLYVTDTLNARVQVFDREGNVVDTFGERGLYVGNMSRPKGVAASEDGLVYVVESFYDFLLVFDRDGRFLLPIGGTGHRPGQFYLPSGVWAGSGGRVYVSDMFNGRVAVLQFLGANL